MTGTRIRSIYPTCKTWICDCYERMFWFIITSTVSGHQRQLVINWSCVCFTTSCHLRIRGVILSKPPFSFRLMPLATKCFMCHFSKFRVYRECAHEVLIAFFSNFVCTINSIFQRRVSGLDLLKKISGKETTNKQANKQQQRLFLSEDIVLPLVNWIIFSTWSQRMQAYILSSQSNNFSFY